jgi:hypothetical protein
MSKGTTYTGIVYLPKHPHADMHGMLRCIVRTRGMSELTSILRTYDIPFSPVLFKYGVWCESKSIIEQTATEHNYGRAMVCPIWQQAVSVDAYELIPNRLKRTVVATGAGLLSSAAVSWASGFIGPHLFMPWDQDIGPRRECQSCTRPKSDSIHVRETTQ